MQMLLQLTSKDSILLNSGEFLLLLGCYATILKAPRGKAINLLPSKYLNIVHVNIVFGDCVSIGGFKFTLIFVDHTMRCNWTFGLKSLHHIGIQVSFFAFQDEVGSLARQFRCDCNEKLFGSPVRSILHLNNSSITSQPGGKTIIQSLH
jgi:hypothetical protein